MYSWYITLFTSPQYIALNFFAVHHSLHFSTTQLHRSL
jgi:hypothetical protein